MPLPATSCELAGLCTWIESSADWVAKLTSSRPQPMASGSTDPDPNDPPSGSLHHSPARLEVEGNALNRVCTDARCSPTTGHRKRGRARRGTTGNSDGRPEIPPPSSDGGARNAGWDLVPCGHDHRRGDVIFMKQIAYGLVLLTFAASAHATEPVNDAAAIHAQTVVVNETTNNYYYGGAYYEKSGGGYTVVAPTAGTLVASLPEGGEEVKVGDITYVKFGETYYQPVEKDGKEMYEIVNVEAAKS